MHTEPASAKPSNALHTCTTCGHRYLPMSNRASSVCDRCLAREFEEELALEIERATAQMPPRRPVAYGPRV